MEFTDNTRPSDLSMVILDIDGTLAEHGWRHVRYMKDGNLDAFHSDYSSDAPTKHAKHIWSFVEALPSNYHLFIVSMRYEKHLEGTIKWLAENISDTFRSYLEPGGLDPKDTFIMTKGKVDNQITERMRQIRRCHKRRHKMAREHDLWIGSTIIFEDDVRNAYAIECEYPAAVIFQPFRPYV